MGFIVRPVCTDDISQILEIENNTFSSPFSQSALEAQLNPENHIFLCAADQSGRVAGYVGMMYVLDEGYINNVAVRPEYRKQGIGFALITGLINECAQKGLSFASLEVRESNYPAIALYSKCSFELAGKRKNYYTKPKEDALIMTYYLNRGNNS